jgi:DnaJ-class molecular chaperone
MSGEIKPIGVVQTERLIKLCENCKGVGMVRFYPELLRSDDPGCVVCQVCKGSGKMIVTRTTEMRPFDGLTDREVESLVSIV